MRPKWWVGHLQGRRPVSRWRRISGIVALLLLGMTFLSYRYITAEFRLRRYAERWLWLFSGGEAHVKQVIFNPFEGLHLVGVTIATPESADFFPPGTSLEDRTIFSAAGVLLRLAPFSVISGDLAVPEIIAVNPRLTLVNRASDGKGNWQEMLGHRRPSNKREPISTGLPEIHLRNVEVRHYQLTERGRAGGTVQMFKAGAYPFADRPQVYDLRITKIIPAEKEEQWTGETGHIQVDMTTGALSGTTLPRLSLDELRLVAPPELNRWIDMLDPEGYVWTEMFRFDPKGGAQADLKLSGARLSVPIDDREAADDTLPRYIRFSEVAGTIRFDSRQAAIEMQGLFRSSPVRLKGTMTLPEGKADGLSGIGFDLELVAEKLPLPRNDADTDEAEKRFVQRWRRLSAFVHDFDGKGDADLVLKLHKEAGEGKGIEFVDGVLRPRGVSAAFDEFPYRLHGVTGEVRFRHDGQVELVNLAGDHGTARVTINGIVAGYSKHDSVKLEIQGRNVELDADLLDCLAEDDRGFCQRFLRRATLDLDVHLYRPATANDGPKGTWSTSLEAVFTDGAFYYAGFPYLLEQLRGRVRVAGGTLLLEELTGSRGPAIVRVSGTATRGDKQTGSLDVRMRAEGVPLDDALAAALPADVRGLYKQYAPKGRADIEGRLFTDIDDGSSRFDLNARLSDAGFSVSGGTARLEDVSADLRIVPETLTVRSLKGRVGDALVDLSGRLGLSGKHPGIAVNLRSDSLELDERLRGALPATLRDVFDSMSPSGRVKLDLAYEEKPQAQSQPEGASIYRAVIEPLGCRIKFSGFPYALEDVKGKVVLTPEGLAIERLAGRHGQASLEVRGRVSTGRDVVRVQIDKLTAHDVPFSEELRKAVPWRLRRMWNDMRPAGSCDLDLHDIVVNRGPGDSGGWKGNGTIQLKRAALVAGSMFTEVDGKLSGSAGYDGQFHFDVNVELRQAKLDGRLLTNVTARMQRPPGSEVVKIQDIIGKFYEGGVLGEVELDYSRKMPTYGISLTVRNVSLEQFLNARRRPDEPPVSLKGRTDGTLALSGRIGDASSRQGSGNVLIHDAQILKVPLLLSILQIVHLAADDNAFHDALLDFLIDGDDVILDRIDLRGKALSMVGAGRVQASDTAMHLILVIGSPLRLPQVAVLSELLEGVARELMEVHVEGTLEKPALRAEVVRSLRASVDAMAEVQVERGPLKRRQK